MIKINLLGDASAVDSSKKLQLGAFAASLVACALIFFIIHYYVSDEVASLSEKSAKLQKDLQKVQRITAEVKEYEAKKADFNAKLSVIAMLKKSKTGPVRVMDDLNNAIPERAWITEIKEENGVFKLSGKALDNQTISSFIRDLDKSDYYDEPRNEVIKLADHQGVKIREFSFEAAVLYAGPVKQVEGEAQETDKKEKPAQKAELMSDESRYVWNFSLENSGVR